MIDKKTLLKHKITAKRLQLAENEAKLKKALKNKSGDLATSTIAVIEQFQRELTTLCKEENNADSTQG